MTRNWTEAEIAAFLAGRLAGAEADRIAAALETDPAAQAAAEAIGPADPAGDARLRATYAEVMDDPVPLALRATLQAPAQGLRGRVGVPRDGRTRAWTPTALADSAALAVGLGVGWGLRGVGTEPAEPAALAATVGPATGRLAEALENRASGPAADGVAVTATFLDAAGRPCREFEALDAAGAPLGAGVACRGASGWRVLVAAAGPEPEAESGVDGYVPAGGAIPDPIGTVLGALDAGPALSLAEEADLIARGWR